jgi:hypothetical protein
MKTSSILTGSVNVSVNALYDSMIQPLGVVVDRQIESSSILMEPPATSAVLLSGSRNPTLGGKLIRSGFSLTKASQRLHASWSQKRTRTWVNANSSSFR